MTERTLRVDTIPVLEETLRIEKAVHEVDRILIKTTVQERIEYAEIDLEIGDALIERVPINSIVDTVPTIRAEGDTIIVPIFEEILVVEKRLMLKEEIHIRRQTVTQHVREAVTLRSEAVTLERPPVPDDSTKDA